MKNPKNFIFAVLDMTKNGSIPKISSNGGSERMKYEFFHFYVEKSYKKFIFALSFEWKKIF